MKRPLIAAAFFTIAAAALHAADAPKLPYTISKETTIITSPLRPDGSPDYVAALNDLLRKGVTLDNNAYGAFVRIVGTESNMFSERTHDQTLALLGIPPTPPDTEVYLTFSDFTEPNMPQERSTAEYERFSALVRTPWRADQSPLAAQYLAKEKRLLDQHVEASLKPHWYTPMVSADGTVLGVLIPSLGRVRDVCRSLCVRATLRAGAGDFDGFLSDVLAAKRYGRHMAEGCTIIEHLVGFAINGLADETIGEIAGRGTLSEAQCAKLAVALTGAESWPPLTRAIDALERWDVLDCTQRIAAGDTKFLPPVGYSSPQDAAPIAIDRTEVDWNYVLKRINQEFDSLTAIMNIESIRELAGRMQEFEKKPEQWRKDLEDQWKAEVGVVTTSPAVHKNPDETREAYSERIARLVMTTYLPSFGKAEELRRRTILSDALARTIVAAAAYKAKTNKWPEKLELLVPDYLAALPLDPYADPPVPPRMLLTDAGLRLYSVGPNGRDDGGVRGPNNADDLSLGANPDAPPPPPQGLP